MKNLVYIVTAFVAGMGIPTMAALNAQLGQRMNSVGGAASWLLCVAALGAICVFFSGLLGAPADASMTRARAVLPPYYFIAGLFMTLYITSITWLAPRYGLGNAIFVVLIGQMVAATIIDHFGLFGARLYALDTKRAFGLLLMALGLYFVRKPVA